MNRCNEYVVFIITHTMIGLKKDGKQRVVKRMTIAEETEEGVLNTVEI